MNIAVIILNFRSASDTIICVQRIKKQLIEDKIVIIVDNSESTFHENELISSLRQIESNYVIIDYSFLDSLKYPYPADGIVLIKGVPNKGYSHGNNVGIRYALNIDALSIMIINPDISLINTNTLTILFRQLFTHPQNYIIAPRVVDSNGIDQNPMKEPGFYQELGQPIVILFKRFLVPRKLKRTKSHRFQQYVSKVSGCCLMIKSSFLKKTDLLDENVFLYCEEAILAKKVNILNGRILYYPYITVDHRHTHKDLTAKNFKQFIVSRNYFLKEYKKYGTIKRCLIFTSYMIIYLYKILHENQKPIPQ